MGQNIREIDPKSFIFLNFSNILARYKQNIHSQKRTPGHRTRHQKKQFPASVSDPDIIPGHRIQELKQLQSYLGQKNAP